MKIKCSYCRNEFNDTLEKCPNCGAPNEGVIRTADRQPVTVEQLKEWYTSKGLPPYEVTRFFIGENYKQPKAFGIYKDEQSGNFVVYKNKASGERAIRYEGTDEAYAVNELFQRLKQEIIEQKAHNVQRRAKRSSSGKRDVGCSFACVIIICALILGCFGFLKFAEIPPAGYYILDNEAFYHISEYKMDYWYVYDSVSDQWQHIDMYEQYPDIYGSRKTAKEYFQAKEWSVSLPCSDFKQSIFYSDYLNEFKVCTGYYSYGYDTYYHLEDGFDKGWYYYDYDYDRWDSVDYDSIPDELTHDSMAGDFYFTPEWDSETQFSDFEDTSYYSDYISRQQDSWNNDDDNDYDWDSNDSWDNDSMDWDSDW